MEVLEDHKEEIRKKLKSLDFNAFKEVSISTSTYDPASVSLWLKQKCCKFYS